MTTVDRCFEMLRKKTTVSRQSYMASGSPNMRLGKGLLVAVAEVISALRRSGIAGTSLAIIVCHEIRKVHDHPAANLGGKRHSPWVDLVRQAAVKTRLLVNEAP